MAKKVVATLKSGESLKMTKALRIEKSSKTGSYIFVEKMVMADKVNEFLAGGKNSKKK